ncbi:MAG: hypothetical protein KGI27_08180 [Thaumarchaeota archaeon]|nr:hypothetical protein [Nitrososphaerota archaeon]
MIAYNFAIKDVPTLHSIFVNLASFIIFFLVIYIPVAILIGYWHRRNQYTVENETLLQENWIWAWQTRFMIRLLQEKTTKEENEQVLKYLEFILKRHKKEHFLNHDPKADSEESV